MLITKLEEHTDMSSASLEKYRQSITDISDHDVVLLLNDVFAMHPKAAFIKNDKHTTKMDTKDLTTLHWRDSINSFLTSTQASKTTPITVSVTSKDIIVTADIGCSKEKSTKDKIMPTIKNETIEASKTMDVHPKVERPSLDLKENAYVEYPRSTADLISSSSLEITSGINAERKSIDSLSTRISISMPSISSLLSGDEPLPVQNEDVKIKVETNSTNEDVLVKSQPRVPPRKRQCTFRPTPLNTINEPYGISYNHCDFPPKLSSREHQSFSFDISPSHRLSEYSMVSDTLPSGYNYERRMTYPFLDIHPPTCNYPHTTNETDGTTHGINHNYQSPPLHYLTSLTGAAQILSPLAASRRSVTELSSCGLELPSNNLNNAVGGYFYDEEFTKRADGISTDTNSSTLFSFPPLSSITPPLHSLSIELATSIHNGNPMDKEDDVKNLKRTFDGKGKSCSTMLCKIPGCFKKRKLGGRCIAHGGGKRCIVVHCMKSAQSYGLCKAHGGGIRCTYQNCTKSSQGNGFCRAHGGGKRCRAENCDKGAQRGEYCAIHGGVKRCQHPNCHRVERGGGFCQVHRQKKICTFKGCTDVATKYFLCARHLQQ